MLVTRIFFFSHNVFKRLLSKGRSKLGLCGKDLINTDNGFTFIFCTYLLKLFVCWNFQSWFFYIVTIFTKHQNSRLVQTEFILVYLTQMMGCLPLVRKHWRKRRKWLLPAFFPSSTVFSKDFFLESLTLYQMTNFRLLQIQGICIQKNKCNFKMKFFSGMVKIIAEKGENAGYQHFLLFPQCFPKAFFDRIVKGRECVVKS